MPIQRSARRSKNFHAYFYPRINREPEFSKHRLQLKILISLSVILGFLIISTILFHYIENLPVLESLYFYIVTSRTIGFGDITAETVLGKILIMFIAFIPASFFIFISTILINEILDNRIDAYYMGKIRKMDNHVIICGYRSFGNFIAKELNLKNIPYIVIEKDPDIADHLIGRKIRVINADPEDEKTFSHAKIDRASALIVSLESDAENLYVVITARNMTRLTNPNLRIIAKINKEGDEDKFRSVGANTVVSMPEIGGQLLAEAASSPRTYEFMINTMTMEHGIVMGEVSVETGSSVINKTIERSGIREECGAIVVSINRGDEYINTPPRDTKILWGDILLLIGTIEQVNKAEAMIKKKEDKAKG